MALLDRNGLYGAPRFHMAAQRAGTRAHIGAEIAVRDAGERVRPPAVAAAQRSGGAGALCPAGRDADIGYQNLCRLITRYKLREGTQSRRRGIAGRCRGVSPKAWSA